MHHTRYRPPSTSFPPLLPPLCAAAETRESSKGRGGRWRDETCDRRNGNSCFRAIRLLSRATPPLYPFADILSPRIFTCLSPFIPFGRRGWNIYRLENTEARVVRFGLKKKRERERSVVSMRNRRTLCFDEQEGEGRKIDNVCFSNFLKFFPFAKKKKKKGNSSRKSSKNSLFLSIRD